MCEHRRFLQSASSSRCSKCQLQVSACELVMRVKHLVFHMHCFTCHACNQQFRRGQQLAVVDDNIYCSTHYHQLAAAAADAALMTDDMASSSMYSGGTRAPVYHGASRRVKRRASSSKTSARSATVGVSCNMTGCTDTHSTGRNTMHTC